MRRPSIMSLRRVSLLSVALLCATWVVAQAAPVEEHLQVAVVQGRVQLRQVQQHLVRRHPTRRTRTERIPTGTTPITSPSPNPNTTPLPPNQSNGESEQFDSPPPNSSGSAY